MNVAFVYVGCVAQLFVGVDCVVVVVALVHNIFCFIVSLNAHVFVVSIQIVLKLSNIAQVNIVSKLSVVKFVIFIHVSVAFVDFVISFIRFVGNIFCILVSFIQFILYGRFVFLFTT